MVEIRIRRRLFHITNAQIDESQQSIPQLMVEFLGERVTCLVGLGEGEVLLDGVVERALGERSGEAFNGKKKQIGHFFGN